MRKTLKSILGTGIVLCGLSSGLKGPCYATSLLGGGPLPPEPNSVAEKVEPKLENEYIFPILAFGGVAVGLGFLALHQYLGRNIGKQNQSQ